MRLKTLSIILANGTPYGVKIAELSNWNGRAIMAPRSALRQLTQLAEAEMPAVYFLLGEDSRVYVGETDELGKRLARHGVEKPNWHELIAFVSPALTKTEVKYLEHAFVARLTQDGLVQLDNGNIPGSPKISVSGRDVMDEFVDRASDVLLSLGYAIVSVNKEVEEKARDTGIEVFCIGTDADARGKWGQNGLLVLSGSRVRIEPTTSAPASVRDRQQYVETGLLREEGRYYVVVQDILFSSASAASGFVLARSSNGMTDWKTKEGKTLKELEWCIV